MRDEEKELKVQVALGVAKFYTIQGVATFTFDHIELSEESEDLWRESVSKVPDKRDFIPIDNEKSLIKLSVMRMLVMIRHQRDISKVIHATVAVPNRSNSSGVRVLNEVKKRASKLAKARYEFSPYKMWIVWENTCSVVNEEFHNNHESAKLGR